MLCEQHKIACEFVNIYQVYIITYHIYKCKCNLSHEYEPIKPITVELVDSTDKPPVIQAPRKSVRVRT